MIFLENNKSETILFLILWYCTCSQYRFSMGILKLDEPDKQDTAGEAKTSS